MKKLIALAAVAACGAALAVESANIVGYQTQLQTKGGYILTAIQFSGVGSEFSVQDIKGDFSGPAWSEDNAWWNTAPTLMIRTAAGGYDYFYYLSDGIDNGDNTFSPGWVDYLAYPANQRLDLGAGFWIYDPHNASATYTVSGEVLSDATSQANYAAGYNLTASPYPSAFNPNNVAWSGIEGPNWSEDNAWWNTAPMIMVRTAAGGYDYYYYLNDGIDNGDNTYSPGWVDYLAYPVADKIISSGAAFWFKPTTSVTATYSL